MANSKSTLPEGTDSILSGAMMDEPTSAPFADTPLLDEIAPEAGSGAAAKLGEAAAKVGDATASLRSQAADKARDYAGQGKDRAVGALENVTRLVDEAAGTIDEKVGEQYGDYARRASGAVAGFADTLRNKDIDELLADAGDLVRKSPAIAIGAAAAIGFVIARLVKAGAPDASTEAAKSPENGEIAVSSQISDPTSTKTSF